MRLKSFLTGISLALACCIVFSQSAYANGYGHGRKHHRAKYYRHYRYYPKDFYFYKKIFFSPEKRCYYYYDVYPEKIYYYGGEKDVVLVNPNYLVITSIVNMASQGVPDAVIIAEIQRTRSKYKLNAEIITYLKQNGLSDVVIDVMLETAKKR